MRAVPWTGPALVVFLMGDVGMNITWLFSLSMLLGLTCMGVCAGKDMSRSGVAPSKALTVVSRYGGEGLVEQAAVEDITNAVSASDGVFAELEALDSHDGLIVRKEAYLYFPVQGVHGLPGYFILKMHVNRKDVSQAASLRIDHAEMTKSSDIYNIKLYIKEKNAISLTRLLYSRHLPIMTGQDENNINTLSKYKYSKLIRGYEFKVNPAVSYRSLAEGYAEINIPINNYYFEQSSNIDRSENLLDNLNEMFCASKDIEFLWDMSKFSSQIMEEQLASMGKSHNLRFDVSLVVQGKKSPRVLWENSQDFVPALRQKIRWKEKDGGLADGEILIRVDEDMDQ